MKLFCWQLKEVPVITYWDLQRACIAIAKRVETSFQSSQGTFVRVLPEERQVYFNSRRVDFDLLLEFYSRLKKREHEAECKTLYCIVKDNDIRKMIVSSGDKHYKVCKVREEWAPTIIINGIVMHTLKRDPIEDAREKVLYVKRGAKVFDTCACFGYTTHACLEKGASYVYATEIDETVLDLSTYNIYSRALGDTRVDLVNESLLDVTPLLRDESFDAIIHDPPRIMSETGDLYSEDLYREFYRLLRKRGMLFHYTGATGSKYRGLDVQRGVIKRLRSVGFHIVRCIEGFGVYAIKS